MYFQLWSFFLKEEQYLSWQNKINHNNQYNKLTWQKIVDFFGFLEVNSALKNELGEAKNQQEFINLALKSRYEVTAEEIAWFLVTRTQIWNFFDLVEKTPLLKEKLLSTKNPQQFISIVADYGYFFSVDELTWLLLEIKSSAEFVSIDNSVGEIINVSHYGKIEIGYWIWLAEEWGVIPPFCHRVQPVNLSPESDLLDHVFLPDRCFLPKSYFNRHLVGSV